MSNKPLSNLNLREQELTDNDLMLISQLTAAGWKSAQVTLEDFFVEMFKPTNSAGQLIQNIQNELTTLENRFDLHENPALNTTDPNYDPHAGFYLRQITKLASNSGLAGNGRPTDPLGLDYNYLNQVYARYDQVVNNLTSTSATIPLSANMGHVLNNDLNTLKNRFDLHENPALNTTDPNYDPHAGFYLRQVTKLASNSGLTGNGRSTDPLGLDYDYLNQVYARYDQVVNNLTSTSATTPLSANMGRALNVAKSEISDVRKNFGGNIVTIVATTGYNMNNAMPGDYVYIEKGVATVTNAPPFQYSTTFTECSYMDVGARFQVARDYITGQFAVRALQNNTWSAWRKNYMEGDIGSNTVVGAADKLNTARRINNVLFDGTQDITVFADKPYVGTGNSSNYDALTQPGYYRMTNDDAFIEVMVVGDLTLQVYNRAGYSTEAGDVYPTRHVSRIKKGTDAWSSWQSVGPKIEFASTGGAGVVQLNNSLTSTATNQALTAAMGKELNDNKAAATQVRRLHGQPIIDLLAPNGYNWNNIQPGDYIFCNKEVYPSQTNAPPFTYCSVYCERIEPSGDSKIAIAREFLTGKQAYRAKANNSWSGWITMMTNSDVENVINNHKAEANPHSQYITAAQLEASAVGGLTEHILDLSGAGFDQNTYYPITINISNYGRCNFEIDTPLYFSTAPWATHGSNSFSVIAKWSEYGYGWGAQAVERTIDTFGFMWSAISPILNIGQMGNSSNVVFWARGKAKYRLKMTKGLVPVIRSSAYSANNETVSPMAYDNTVPVSIQQRKLDASHVSEDNPHPQYAKQTWVNDTYFPRSGGTITGYTNINNSFGVMGTTDLKTTNVDGNLTCVKEVRGYNLRSLNPSTGVGMNIGSWAADIIVYNSYNTNPMYNKVEHYFRGGPILSEDGFSNLIITNNDSYSGYVTNTQGQVIGNFTASYIIINQRIKSPGIDQGYERWCQMIINVQFNSQPGEVSSLMYFPISFKRPPTITTARRLFDKDSAGTPEDGDAGALLQYVGTQYCYISLQYFTNNWAGSARGYTLNIAGWVPA